MFSIRLRRFLYARRRARRTGRRISRGSAVILLAVLAAAVLFLMYALVNTTLRPIVSEIAAARVKNVVNSAINKAINAEDLASEMDYNNLIVLQKDTSGKITAVITQMSAVNKLRAMVVSDVIDQIYGIKTEELSIPVGTLIGGQLFSGRGPKLPVRILHVSSVSADFSNKFDEAGINQTRHEIIMTVNVDISIFMSGFTENTSVQAQISVAEAVIVGNVPDSYAYFEDAYSTTAQNYLNLPQ